MLEHLCNINEIEDPGAKGFTFKKSRKECLVFIVKKDKQVYAYENHCPHAGINLEWQENDFLDNEQAFIQCSVHGALFTIEKGECAGGPCNGQGLTPLVIDISTNGDIHLNL